LKQNVKSQRPHGDQNQGPKVGKNQHLSGGHHQQQKRDPKLRWNELPAYVEGDDAYNKFRGEADSIQERGVTRPKDAKCKVIWRTTDLLRTGFPFVAHAIARDRKMGRGVARHIRNINGAVELPIGETGDPGCVIAVPMTNPQFKKCTLLHTVYKNESTERLQDTMGDFVESYEAGYKGVAEWCKRNNVRELGMSPMGCRTDCLFDGWMEQKIWDAFADQDILITICIRPSMWRRNRVQGYQQGSQWVSGTDEPTEITPGNAVPAAESTSELATDKGPSAPNDTESETPEEETPAPPGTDEDFA
jgi:hypothetical protein